jgi:hypothetical protein
MASDLYASWEPLSGFLLLPGKTGCSRLFAGNTPGSFVHVWLSCSCQCRRSLDVCPRDLVLAITHLA